MSPPTSTEPATRGQVATEEFVAEIYPIEGDLRAEITSSWRDGCPIELADLRYVRLSHHNFSGGVEQGELVAHVDVAEDLVAVFRELFLAQFPIERMELVDAYDANDALSMQANNTSAFNCRAVAGTQRWSEHAYGKAVDINPLVNPYVIGSSVFPAEGAIYTDRSVAVLGGIYADGPVVEAFEEIGWSWGGYWSSGQDYQHFSLSGR